MGAINKNLAKSGAALAVVAAMTLASPTTADAAFIISICDDAACAGGGDTFVTDEGAGDGFTGVGGAGIVTTTGAAGGWEFTLSASQSKPAFGSASKPKINLTYSLNNLINGALASIWLYAADTGFTGVGAATMVANSTTGGQTTSAFTLGGDDNSDQNHGPAILTVGPLVGIFSNTVSGGLLGGVANPYSMAAGVSVSRLGLGASSGDVTITVPEPASMALFGLGLFGVGLATRRRRRQARQ